MKKDECRACGKCCMAFEIGPITEVEAKSGFYEVYEDHLFSGEFHIKKHRPEWAPEWANHGVCAYLGEDMKCSIYENRPGLCRSFSCRENSEDRKRYLRARRKLTRVKAWSEYERKAFGRFLD